MIEFYYKKKGVAMSNYIRYQGQIYKAIDAGESKIADMLKRYLQSDLSQEAKAAGMSIEVQGSIQENKGGKLECFLKFPSGMKATNELARHYWDQMGQNLSRAMDRLYHNNFIKSRYHINVSTNITPSGNGRLKKFGYIIVEPKTSNKSLNERIGVSPRNRGISSEDKKFEGLQDLGAFAAGHRLDARMIKKIGSVDSGLAIKLSNLLKKQRALDNEQEALRRSAKAVLDVFNRVGS